MRALAKLVAFVLTLAVVVSAGAQPIIQQPSKPLDVPYIATHDRVVRAMLELAKATKHDFLIDLGCGDGRIPIAAAKRFGTRGLGIDLDPERIAEAKANARSAGVEDRVRFIEGDIFEADLRNATVVMLYLSPRSTCGCVPSSSPS